MALAPGWAQYLGARPRRTCAAQDWSGTLPDRTGTSLYLRALASCAAPSRWLGQAQGSSVRLQAAVRLVLCVLDLEEGDPVNFNDRFAFSEFFKDASKALSKPVLQHIMQQLRGSSGPAQRKWLLGISWLRRGMVAPFDIPSFKDEAPEAAAQLAMLERLLVDFGRVLLISNDVRAAALVELRQPPGSQRLAIGLLQEVCCRHAGPERKESSAAVQPAIEHLCSSDFGAALVTAVEACYLQELVGASPACRALLDAPGGAAATTAASNVMAMRRPVPVGGGRYKLHQLPVPAGGGAGITAGDAAVRAGLRPARGHGRGGPAAGRWRP